MSHTPGPWHSPGLSEIHDEQHRVIAECGTDDEIPGDECQANADFIVRAVNLHAELLAALEALLHEYALAHDDEDKRGDPYLDFNSWEEVIQARAAIARAKGEV